MICLPLSTLSRATLAFSIHQTLCPLNKTSRPTGIPLNIFGCVVFCWRVVDLLGAISQRKRKLTFAIVFFSACAQIPSSMLGFGLALACTGFVCVITTPHIHIYSCLAVSRSCFPVVIQCLALILFSLPLLKYWFLSLVRGQVLFRDDYSVVSFSLYFDQLWISVSITIYNKQKLLK